MISITYTKLCAMPPPKPPSPLKHPFPFIQIGNLFPFYSMYKFSPLLYHVFYAMVFPHLSLQIRRSIYLFFFYNTLLPLKKRRNLWINTRIYALRKDDNKRLAHPDLDDMIYAAIEFSRLQHLSLSDIYAILC